MCDTEGRGMAAAGTEEALKGDKQGRGGGALDGSQRALRGPPSLTICRAGAVSPTVSAPAAFLAANS